MNRRQSFQSIGFLSAHALFPSVLTGFLASCTNGKNEDYTFSFFNQEQVKTLVDVIDAIIPATSTPSASMAKTHHFLDEIFLKCLPLERQKEIADGIDQITKLLPQTADKTKLIHEIDQKAFADQPEYAFFKVLKQCTLIGYFTSQEGETQASNYVKVPDEYKGEVPATDSTLNYGKTNLTFNI